MLGLHRSKPGCKPRIYSNVVEQHTLLMASIVQSFLREDMEAQREIYRSVQEADRVNVKILLRDCLRKNDIQCQISKLANEEITALINAIRTVGADKIGRAHV